MTPDGKHRLGAAMMWGGVAVTGLAAVVVLPVQLPAGLALFAGGIGLTAVGAVTRKRFCPKCRAEACELPATKTEQPPKPGEHRKPYP